MFVARNKTDNISDGLYTTVFFKTSQITTPTIWQQIMSFQNRFISTRHVDVRKKRIKPTQRLIVVGHCENSKNSDIAFRLSVRHLRNVVPPDLSVETDTRKPT